MVHNPCGARRLGPYDPLVCDPSRNGTTGRPALVAYPPLNCHDFEALLLRNTVLHRQVKVCLPTNRHKQPCILPLSRGLARALPPRPETRDHAGHPAIPKYSARVQQRDPPRTVQLDCHRPLTCPNDLYRSTWDLFACKRSVRQGGTSSADVRPATYPPGREQARSRAR